MTMKNTRRKIMRKHIQKKKDNLIKLQKPKPVSVHKAMKILSEKYGFNRRKHYG